MEPTSPATTESSSGAAGSAVEPSAPQANDDATGAEESGGLLAATMAELRKVVWPSRQQLFSESVAVILMVGLSAAAIAAIDRFYGWVAAQVFG